MGTLPDQYHEHAKLMMRFGTEVDIRQLVDSSNRPVGERRKLAWTSWAAAFGSS